MMITIPNPKLFPSNVLQMITGDCADYFSDSL